MVVDDFLITVNAVLINVDFCRLRFIVNRDTGEPLLRDSLNNDHSLFGGHFVRHALIFV